MKRPPGLPDDEHLQVPYQRTFDRAIGLDWEPIVRRRGQPPTVLRQVRAGRIRVRARALRGEMPDRTVWQVEALDDDGELCATSVVIMASVARRSG